MYFDSIIKMDLELLSLNNGLLFQCILIALLKWI